MMMMMAMMGDKQQILIRYASWTDARKIVESSNIPFNLLYFIWKYAEGSPTINYHKIHFAASKAILLGRRECE